MQWGAGVWNKAETQFNLRLLKFQHTVYSDYTSTECTLSFTAVTMLYSSVTLTHPSQTLTSLNPDLQAKTT